MILKREDQLDCISSRLVYWKEYIKVMGKLNLLNGHTISEDFYCHLLNYTYDWNLINMNSLNQNAEGIDLIDHRNRILVQVTSTSTKAKLNHTIKKTDSSKYKGYRLYMMFLGEMNENIRKLSPTTSNILFDPMNNCIDVISLMRVVRSLPDDKLTRIFEIVTDQIRINDIDYKLTSDLSKIVLSLAGKDFREYHKKKLPLPFKIQQKIEYNHLFINKELIEKNNIYYTIMQKIYDTFDNEACNTGEAVWEKIAQFSRDIQIEEDLQGDKLFSRICKECINHLSKDSELKYLTLEKIENYAKIIVVDAFLRCKIMRIPGEDEPYVATV